MPTPVLHTERLILCAFTDADIPQLLPLIGAREVAENTLRIPHPYEEKHAREFFESIKDKDDAVFAIHFNSDNSLVGGMGLHPDHTHRRAELGYWIGVPFWGHGYATEAARAVLRYGFEELNLNRIFASHFASNPASGKVLRKIGMKREGCARQHILKWGKLMDVELYAILRDDLPQPSSSQIK